MKIGICMCAGAVGFVDRTNQYYLYLILSSTEVVYNYICV